MDSDPATEQITELAKIPVIVMTAKPSGITSEERELVQGLLTKPFEHHARYAAMEQIFDGN